MLRHSSDAEPGFTRQRMGRHWAYFDGDTRVTDRATIDRLNAIGLPPAYGKAWFCKDANGHLQAIGIDARGRKQYRYHPEYRAKQDGAKFDGLCEFGKALPKIRRKVETDLRERTLSKDKVLAAVVRLLDEEYLRVGNQEYAKANKSFGATTLLSRQVHDDGRKVKMRFKAKSGVEREVAITGRTLRRLVRQLQELPGQALFQYINGDGNPHPVSSSDVNDYIREASGGEFTAKHFRTWGASAIAFEQLLDHSKATRISVNTMVEPVAEALGNTVTISRKAYVHPSLIEAVKEQPRNPLNGMERPPARKRLSSVEVALLDFLAPPQKRRRKSAVRTASTQTAG
ncbi:MAG TPA: DNA topoisomerase IB [Sphingomicrobium sp.]|jgi:DNA topoisomerase-1|nr:DNA topoisomerase IB [Sphingomicrobium sp.]